MITAAVWIFSFFGISILALACGATDMDAVGPAAILLATVLAIIAHLAQGGNS